MFESCFKFKLGPTFGLILVRGRCTGLKIQHFLAALVLGDKAGWAVLLWLVLGVGVSDLC